MTAGNGVDGVRLDKWLWAARFFKTRKLAVEAINGGKVHLNGQRTRPGKEVRVGSQLRIHKGQLEWDVVVRELARQRRPASEVANFYEEDPGSAERRRQRVEERRALRSAGDHARPTKRDRRMIHRFTRKSD